MSDLGRLFDSHCHLDFESFTPEIEAVLDRARAVGVTRLVTIGSGRDLRSAAAAVDLAKRHAPFVHATVAVHPHDAKVLDDDAFTTLSELARDPLVVAIGETGLDYHYDHSPRDVQQIVFRRFIALAREVKKPIVIHTRNAPVDTLAILREEKANDVGGIIHCFSEDVPFARAALDLGFVASFSGIVTFKKATAIREAAARQPLDAILIETDAPYLAPVPYRGKPNEPSYIAHTAACIAELRSTDPRSVREATYENACRVFGLPAAI
jgi:TatD DNase family protein